MSYQVLARKWRPSKFAELVGQSHVVSAISNALDNDRLHHAYLFTGTRGVGKTTIARIFAKSLNCETGQGANPCGICGTCQEIDRGSFVDLLEIDAASRTKVEDTRELLDNVQYRPTRGKYKVYLIDEVHMLSKHSFNALLKTLEEPPEHVKFLLATTDPQKLPVTILSRCLQFNLKALSREQIQQQLSHVLSQEQITHEPSALAQLARAANGSMRDALSLTDQAIAQGNNQVTLETVIAMLGLLDKSQLLKILHAILENDSERVIELVNDIAVQSPDYQAVYDELISLLHQVALTQLVPNACKLETISAKAIYTLAKAFSPEHVQLLYQLVIQGKKDLPYVADGRLGLEMTLLRLLSFTPATPTPEMEEAIRSGMAEHRVEIDEQVVFANVQTPNVHSTVVAEPKVFQEPSAPIELSAPVEPSAPTTDYYASESDSRWNAENEQAQDDLANDEDDDAPKREDLDTVIDDMFTTSAEPDPEPSTEMESALPTEPVSAPAYMDEVPPMDDDSDNALMYAEQDEIFAQAEQQHPNAFESRPVADKPATDDLLGALDSLKHIRTKKTDEENTSEASAQQPPALESDAVTSAEVETETTQNSVSEFVPSEEELAEAEDFVEPEADIEETEVVSPSAQTLEPTSQFAPSAQILPETNPSQMGLGTDNQAQAHSLVPGVTPDNLVAELPNGDTLMHEAQIDEWSNMISHIKPQSFMQVVMMHSAMQRSSNQIMLTVGQEQSHLLSDTLHNKIQEAISKHLQQPIELQIKVGVAHNTPMQIKQKIKAFRLQHANQLFASDPDMQKLMNTFNAQVKDGSMQPKP